MNSCSLPNPSACAIDQLVQRRLDLKLGDSPAEQALQLLDLNEMLGNQVTARDLRKIYDEIDLPLAAVLARMEYEGIQVDRDRTRPPLRSCSKPTSRASPKRSAPWPDCEFNISSPAATGQGPLRADEAARAGEVRKGQDHFHRGRRPRGLGRKSMRSRARFSNIANSPNSKAPTSTRCPR